MRRLAVLLALSILAAVPGTARATPHGSLRVTSATPGQAVTVSGRVTGARRVKLQVLVPGGAVRGPYGPYAVSGKRLRAKLPAAATARLGRDVRDLAVAVLPAGATRTRRDAPAAGRIDVPSPTTGLTLTNSFVSAKGWVKPGETFPLTVTVRNDADLPADGGTVTIPPVAGMSFTKVEDGGATIDGGTVKWAVGQVGPASSKRVVLEATTATTGQDAEVVWKNLSTTATSTTAGTSTSHGPKVIPPSETYDTARYGDRPFPVVPVDYFDRKHAAESGADKLASKINDAGTPGSTFNLYQEMSYGQLFPQGDVPSLGVATRGYDYAPGFSFSKRVVKADSCAGTTAADLPLPVETTNPERIHDGWYQLPGDTGYYGSDSNGSALIGALSGVGALQSIDSGCGPAGKAVYDAAQIADPEIDYDSFDTDKDGVVDFFMMIFPGVGGNGGSQTEVPPYDNIWPHSSSLEDSFVDPATGLAGYVTDDQAKDRLGRPLWYADESRTSRTTDDKGEALKAFTRVGPYNVNPETAIEKASVISHEYGHSLGLPDFYTTGGRETYGDWNLMATDHSQHMDVFSRQDLGWLVPTFLEPGRTDVSGAVDSTHDVHKINWKTPAGKPYTLSGDGVHNGQAYMAKLPQRQIIAPDKVPSGSHLYWSQAGNDFGCPPLKGHNLDIDLSALRDVPAGTPVTLTFKSSWEIEWDYDYGFVLTSSDGGKSYQSHASANGYTTDGATNPNSSPCQAKFGNGITGSSDRYANGTPQLDRVLGEYGTTPLFLDDAYDLTDLAGKASVLRFTYATDPGAAKAGWFIDDVEVKAGDRVIYSSDFESSADSAIYNGGCREDLQTATVCTKGWQYTSAVDGSPADHAYYLELRDRAGFDADGHGEDDRATSDDPPGPNFEPGVSLVYTDENHGYGNVGTDDPPAQSPLDAKPEPGSDAPNLDDAGFTAAADRSAFSDAAPGRVDNYLDPNDPSGNWTFAYDCLSFKVNRMGGEAVGPTTAPGDLTADLALDAGKGCGAFDFGYSKGSNAVSVPGTGAAAATASCPAHPKHARVRARGGRRGVRLITKGAAKVVVRRVATARRPIKPKVVRRGSVKSVRRLPRRKGIYVVSVKGRRIVVRRAHGRFKVRPDYRRGGSCGILKTFRLAGPGFAKRGLRGSYSLSASGTVGVTVLRGKRVVKRIRPRARKAGRTYRLRLKARRRGEYTVVVHAKGAKRTATARLVSRRL